MEKKVFQPIQGRSLAHIMKKKLGLPKKGSYALIRMCKQIANPRQFFLRKSLANNVKKGNQVIKEGYKTFKENDIPGIANIIHLCQKITENKLTNNKNPKIYQRNVGKDFLLPILGGKEFLDYPDLIQFIVSNDILNPVVNYLGTVPIFAGANIFWSPANQTATSSQLFHLDTEDYTQIKVFINICDVSEENGPFAFLPANLSQKFLKKINYSEYDSRRFQDDEIFSHIDSQNVIKLIGKAGSGAFVDTAQCLHYGSRLNKYDRIILMLQYQRFDTPLESVASIDIPSHAPFFASMTNIQKLTLGYI
ncbi:MAG: hypothetical protein K1X44_02530 [Alphaproteobacteria bacterium]|nr:hypothetical protein [Alphaproteobacteria bacterium]